MPESARRAVLTGWKEIGQYMGKGVRTVQRWEQSFGLPIRRPPGANKRAILARPQDLDAWVAMNCHTVYPVADGGTKPIITRTSLSCELETARILRRNVAESRAELRRAILLLRESIEDCHRRCVPVSSSIAGDGTNTAA